MTNIQKAKNKLLGKKSIDWNSVYDADLGAGIGLAGNYGSRLISGGLQSGVGNAVGNIGSTVGGAIGTVNPVVGAIVSGGSAVVGGGINRLFGMKTDQAQLNKVNNAIAANNNFVSNAGSFDAVELPAATMMNTDVYTGGVFYRGKAADKNADLRRRLSNSVMFANNSVGNNINNLATDQMAGALANYSAFGGPLVSDGIGAVEYGLLSDYLLNKRLMAENKNKLSGTIQPTMFSDGGDIHIKPSHRGRLTELKKRTGKTEAELYNDGNPAHKKMVVFARNARKWKHGDGGPLNLLYQGDSPYFAFGGDMQSNSADFPTGLTHVSAGGSHEENPNQGVQMGVDAQGVPNLVEENETVWNDYVFSNRIKCDTITKEMFHLPKKKDVTYAELSKKLEKEIKERPNDAISRAGFNAQMQTLQEQQERQKTEMEAERARAAFEALSPGEQTAIMNGLQTTDLRPQTLEGVENPQEAAMIPATEAPVDVMPVADATGTTAAPVMAEGGHLFPWGGFEKLFSIEPPYTPSNGAGFIPYNRKLTPEEVMKLEQEQRFIDWTKYVNDNWDTPEVQNYLKALDNAAGGNHLYDAEGNLLPTAKDYYNNARTKNHLWGYYHLTPEYMEEVKELQDINPNVPRPKGSHVPTIEDVDPNAAKVLDKAGMGLYSIQDNKQSKGKTKASVPNDNDEETVVPKLRAEWPRYLGLFGPAVGLGLMGTGLGKPDYSGLNAALASTNQPAHLARPYLIGNYVPYKPFDIWSQRNRNTASLNSAIRAISNTSSPSKNAGILAALHNATNNDGELGIAADKYNYDNLFRSEEFNRGTNIQNANTLTQNSQFNADALNRARQYRGQLALQAATEKLNRDAQWYNSLYGNIGGLFRGLSDLGRENAQWNMMSDLAADDAFGNLGTSYTGRKYMKRKKNNGSV